MTITHSARSLSVVLAFLASFVVLAFLVSAVQTASANSDLIPSTDQGARVNNHTIGIVFTHEELYHQLVHNLESALEPPSGMRIVPIMGKNHVQSIYDLLYLRGVDLAMVRADAIEYVRREGNFRNIYSLIRNITKVSDEKIVIIANKDIKSLADLRGKTVVFGAPGTGEHITGTTAFDTIGLNTETLTDATSDGIDRLKSGEASAVVYLLKTDDAIHSAAAKKNREQIMELTKDDDVHIIPVDEDNRLSSIYTPSTLTHDDLPSLIDEGAEVNTYSVDAILAAYNWNATHPRLRKVSRFVNALFGNLDSLQTDAYEPVWGRVDLRHNSPKIQKSILVEQIIEEQERLIEEQRAAEAQRIRELKAAEIERLAEKRNQLIKILSEKIYAADSEQTEELSEQLNQFLSILESETNQTAGSSDQETISDTDTETASDEASAAEPESEQTSQLQSTQETNSTAVANIKPVVPMTNAETEIETENETETDPITFKILPLESISAPSPQNAGSIIIQEKLTEDTADESKYLSLNFALDGLVPGAHTVSIHESADCVNPGKDLNTLPEVVAPDDGKIEDSVRIDGMDLKSFANRSIVITHITSNESGSILCGTST